MPADKRDISLIETQDGSHSLFSEQFGETYHSRYGAIQESLHVFIKAGLLPKLEELDTIHILEIGFGSGLNAFMTFLEAEKWGKSIVYETIEAYPVSVEDAAKLNYPTALKADNQKAIFDKMHECEWETTQQLSPNFLFKKRLMQEVLKTKR